MTGQPTTKPRKFRGYAVIERPDGALAWGTFRPTAAEALKQWHTWNPPLADHPSQARAVRAEIVIFDK